MKHVLQSLVLFVFCVVSSISWGQGVAISESGASPHSSAGLEVDFSNKGFLPPRMTTSERDGISNPAIGLMVFNTDSNCLNMWTGVSWKQSCFDCDFAAPAVSNSGPVCEGENLSLNASSIPGATYSWTGPNGFSSSDQNPTLTGVSSAAGGIYSLVVTYNGCSSTAVATTAVINAAPDAPVINSNGPLCVGQNLVLTTSTIPGATHAWTGPNAYTGNTQNITVSNVTTQNAGTYSLVLTVSGCQSEAGEIDLTVHNSSPAQPEPVTGIISPCLGSENYSIPSVATSTSYTWTVPSFASITSGQGTTGISVNFNTTGSGSITVVANNACGSSTPRTLSTVAYSSGGGSLTFNYTGSEQTFGVPGCLTDITIEAWGAQGGNSGGLGGYAKGTFAASPGQLLRIYVGGQGGSPAGGFNGGGEGSNSGGGGASDVRTGTEFTDRIIVAGGGGGSTSWGSVGGAGGGSTGGSGTNSSTYSCGGQTAYGIGGGGGTQSSGGSAGSFVAGAIYGGNNGHPGTLGLGGGADGWNNGGGGGGYYGGGSGGTPGCSGWGAGGGGGSSYTGSLSDTSMQSGVRNGHGQVILSW